MEIKVGEVTIADVCHFPESNFNLFSLTRMQKKGWTLSSNAENIKLQKGVSALLFNIVVNTPKGALYVGKFCRKGGDDVMGEERLTKSLPTVSTRLMNS
jgi:hypothetical protein